MENLPGGVIRCPACGQVLVGSAMRCQFCGVDVSKVPRPAGVAQAGASRWNEPQPTNWDSVLAYVAGGYWLCLCAFKVAQAILIPGGLIFIGLDFIFGAFLAFAYLARPDWAQLAVRYISAVDFLFSVMGVFMAAGVASIVKSPSVIMANQIAFVFNLLTLIVSLLGLYLSREDGIF